MKSENVSRTSLANKSSEFAVHSKLKDRVKIYITGAAESGANRWFNFSTFPVPKTQLKKLYLHSQGDAQTFPGNGALAWDKPKDEPCDHYTYDPAVPINNFFTETYKDRRSTEILQ